MNSDGNGHWDGGVTGLLAKGPTVSIPTEMVPQAADVEETGLRPNLLEELALKCLHYAGRLTAHEVGQTLALPFSVVREVLESGRGSGLCEVVGARGLGEQGYEYVLTDAGRARAEEMVGRGAYCGPAPVPFAQYLAVMERQLVGRRVVGRQALLSAMGHLVVAERLVGVLGAGLNSGRPILLYGPSGNGKTSLARALGEAMAGQEPIWIPYCVEAAGHLIQVFDPAVHERVLEKGAEGPALLSDWRPGLDAYDRRWVLIRRPQVVAGGELTMGQFELVHEPTANVYHAPLQMKAAGGTLLIDDFGRQVMRPQDLLNRWIVPLERQRDLLSFRTGQTIEVPLHLVLILATNLDPAALVDEAYLRRLRYKVRIGNPSLAQFRRIFQQACARSRLTYEESAVTYLRDLWYSGDREMRACHPADLVNHILDICRFEGRVAELSPELLDAACAICFEEQKTAAATGVTEDGWA